MANDISQASVDRANNNSINQLLTQKVSYLNKMKNAIINHDYLMIYKLLDPQSYSSVVGDDGTSLSLQGQSALVDNIRPRIAHFLSANLINYLGQTFPFLYYQEYKLGKFHIYFGNWWGHHLFGSLNTITVNFSFNLNEFNKLKESFDTSHQSNALLAQQKASVAASQRASLAAVNSQRASLSQSASVSAVNSQRNSISVSNSISISNSASVSASIALNQQRNRRLQQQQNVQRQQNVQYTSAQIANAQKELGQLKQQQQRRNTKELEYKNARDANDSKNPFFSGKKVKRVHASLTASLQQIARETRQAQIKENKLERIINSQTINNASNNSVNTSNNSNQTNNNIRNNRYNNNMNIDLNYRNNSSSNRPIVTISKPRTNNKSQVNNYSTNNQNNSQSTINQMSSSTQNQSEFSNYSFNAQQSSSTNSGLNSIEQVVLKLERKDIVKYFKNLDNFVDQSRRIYHNYILHLAKISK